MKTGFRDGHVLKMTVLNDPMGKMLVFISADDKMTHGFLAETLWHRRPAQIRECICRNDL
jgi:hypothetical protein